MVVMLISESHSLLAWWKAYVEMVGNVANRIGIFTLLHFMWFGPTDPDTG